jgi:hypothetical protein
MLRWALLLGLLGLAMPAEASSRAALQAAVDCAVTAPAEAMAGCARPLGEAIAACLLRGEGVGVCLGLREAGLLGACLASGEGLSAETLAACLTLRAAAREAAKCLSVGLGVPGGCLGPGNTLRQWGEAGMAAWDQGRERGWAALMPRLPGF